MEFCELPSDFGPSHLFRIKHGREDEECEDQRRLADVWIPIQLRFASPPPSKWRPGSHFIEQTAEPDVGVVIMSAAGGIVAGLRKNLKTSFRIAEFSDPATVFDHLDAWFRDGERMSKAAWVRYLRSQHAGLAINDPVLSAVKRSYLDPLGAGAVEPSGDLEGRANLILGGRYRFLWRKATYIRREFYVTLHGGGRPALTDSDDFQFLIVPLPETSLQADGLQTDNPPPLFLFPKEVLRHFGALSTSVQRGKSTFYLFPPFIAEKRRITSLRKAEQAPYFVSDVDRFRTILEQVGE